MLDKAGIRYLVGGSVASGIWGEPRQTNDVDVEVWLNAENIDIFASAFGTRYYISKEDLARLKTAASPFESLTVLDIEAVLKFDCFIQGFSPIDEEAYSKSVITDVGSGKVRVACAEHIVVQKLRWFNLGNRASERQWRDVLSVARVSALDWPLVDRWAGLTGVQDLATKLRDEST